MGLDRYAEKEGWCRQADRWMGHIPWTVRNTRAPEDKEDGDQPVFLIMDPLIV